MEWKLLDVCDIKPIYEISQNGDIRKLGNKRLLRAPQRVSLTLQDGTYKHFLREDLVNAVFNKTEWTPLEMDGIKPIYEISKDGDVRKIDTKCIMKGHRKISLQKIDGGRITISKSTLVNIAHNIHAVWKPLKGFNLKPIYEISSAGYIRNTETGNTLYGTDCTATLIKLDGSRCKFIKAALTNAVHSNIYESDNTKFDDDVLNLMKDVHVTLNEIIKFTIVDVVKSKHDNMFIIKSDRFKYPISVRKETNGSTKYIIRTGMHWLDTDFYGYEYTSKSRVYAECTSNDVIMVIKQFAMRNVEFKNKGE